MPSLLRFPHFPHVIFLSSVCGFWTMHFLGTRHLRWDIVHSSPMSPPGPHRLLWGRPITFPWVLGALGSNGLVQHAFHGVLISHASIVWHFPLSPVICPRGALALQSTL